MTLKEKDRQYIWHPFTPLEGAAEPLLVRSAEGVYLQLEDGRKIIDAVSSWWVNLHGHANPQIAKAISEQAAKLEHVIFAGFTHAPAIHLAEKLLSILPYQKKIFFSDNGSTAVEVAIKMAIQYWANRSIHTKRKIVALEGAYHGDTFGAMAVGERGTFTKPFSNFLFDVEFIPFPSEDNKDKSLQQFEEIIKQGEVAAFIYEPLVQGAGGMRMYASEVLETLLQLADAHDVICIADEVFTNFGRTGKLFASDYVNAKPDILCLSKGITGGFLPLGITTCNGKIVEAFRSDKIEHTFFHGHSYTANPIICSAALASFDILMSEECQSNIERITHSHQQFKMKLVGHKFVRDVRSRGTILAIEIKVDDGSSYFNSIRGKIYSYFLERGILLRPLGNTIYVLPPYIITDKELKYIYQTIEEFLSLIE